MTPARNVPLKLLCNIVYTQVPHWYGASQCPLHLDVICPRKAEPRPLLLWFCGGAFQQVDHHVWIPDLMWFAERGLTIASVEYRVGVAGCWPAAVEDAWAALRYLRYHAEALNINPDKVIAVGESAGGLLASSLGLSIRRPNDIEGIQAVVDYYGVTDLAAAVAHEQTQGISAIQQWMQGTPEQRPEAYAAASPAEQVTADAPPFFLLHGKADQRVPFSQSEVLQSALQACGVPTALKCLEHAGHGDPAFYTTEIKEEVLSFINKCVD